MAGSETKANRLLAALNALTERPLQIGLSGPVKKFDQPLTPRSGKVWLYLDDIVYVNCAERDINPPGLRSG